MAIRQRVRVQFEDVFPEGAFVVGEVTPVEDFEASQAARDAGREPGDVQSRDKETDQRVWQVRVMDPDPEARKGKGEVTVKISADQQPVPPPKLDGLPFRPVVFEGLTATAWLKENGTRSSIEWSLRADRMTAAKAPTAGATSAAPSSGSTSSSASGSGKSQGGSAEKGAA